MKTLVLCVDRDDDLGTKAGVNGPVIGREENLEASIAMALADPEEADTNTLFAGLQLYDDLVKRGMEVEVATISGDSHVGVRSDLILTTQLENVLEVVKPDRAILVSDGAEDEWVYPIISSRIKIDSVKRVYVKQSPSLEGTYYLIIKTLQDEKMRRRWVIPLSLLLIIPGLWSLGTKLARLAQEGADQLSIISQMTLGVIGVVLGLYLLGWAYRWPDLARERVANFKRSVRQGSLAIPFAMVGLMLAIVGILIGYDTAMVYREGFLPGESTLAVTILRFTAGAVWFVVFGVLAYESGKAINAFLHTGKIKWSFIVMMVSVLATGFVVQGAVDALEFFVGNDEIQSVMVFAEMITGVLIAVFSAVLHASLRSEAADSGTPAGA
jgi:putative membrane protein